MASANAFTAWLPRTQLVDLLSLPLGEKRKTGGLAGDLGMCDKVMKDLRP